MKLGLLARPIPSSPLTLLLLATAADGRRLSTSADAANATAAAPVCAEGEKLFRLRLITGGDGVDDSWDGAPVSYRVFTQSAGEVHASCAHRANVRPGADVRLCLPEDGCHTVAVGRGVGRWISCRHGGVEEMVASWGNETVRRSNAYFFDRVDFGEGCRPDSFCDPSTESEFEFFLDRRGDERIADPFTWSLTTTTSAEDEAEDVSLVWDEAPFNESAFVYERACVPRDSCLEFRMGYPSDSASTGWYDASPYSIRLDGTIVAEHTLGMGPGPGKLSQTEHLGDGCTVDAACDRNAEDFVRIEFVPRSEAAACSESGDSFDFSSAVPRSRFPFWLQDRDDDDFENYYVWNSHFEDFEVGGSYAVSRCIPKDRCAKLFVATDIPAESYAVHQNGEERTTRVVHADHDDDRRGYTSIDLGDLALYRNGQYGVCASATAAGIATRGMLAATAVALFVLRNAF